MLLGQRLVNSLGLTGMAMTGVDIGGFSGNPTPELMVRWNSLGVYTPMFRNHAMQGTIYREPWRWGEANEAIIKKDIEQRYRLPALYLFSVSPVSSNRFTRKPDTGNCLYR